MSFIIHYKDEIFISDKLTSIQAIQEYDDFRKKTTNEKIQFFLLRLEEM